MSSCLHCFLTPSPQCSNRTHFHEASVKITRDQFGLNLTTEETPDGHWHFKLLSPEEKGRFLSELLNPAGSHGSSEPQSSALSTNVYQLLQHLDICKHFTHGKTSQRMTSGEERSHSALLASEPVLQKHDECAVGLTGGVHTGQLCRASRQCAERPQQPPAHWAHHPPLCTKPLLVHAQSCRFLRSRVR